MGTSGYSSSSSSSSSSTNGDTSAQSNELDEGGVNITPQEDGDVISKTLLDIHSQQIKMGVQMPKGPSGKSLPTPCYDVGDVGPSGGIVVATPNTSGNNTQYYYEISPNDLHQNQNLIYTSQSCNYQICEWGFKGIDIPTQCPVGEGINNTNNTSTYIPNNECPNSLNAFTLCSQYSLGGNDDWFLPSKDEWNLVRSNVISVFNNDCTPLGSQMDPCSISGETPYWSSSAAENHQSACGFYHDWTGNTPDNWNALICTASGDFLLNRWADASVRAMRRFTCPYVSPNPVTLPCYDVGDITPQGGMIFAIPYTGWNNSKYYYEVGLTDLHTGGTPLNNANMQTCDVTGSALTGAEWGIHGETNIGTSINFGDGYKNTILIDAFPTGPNNPYISTREVAATICLNYGISQQHILEEGEEWFLPSLYEFWYMYHMVGPGTPFGTTLDLSECQVGSLQSGAMTNDGRYWTSSQYSNLVDSNNPGSWIFSSNPLPANFPGAENFAWTFINTANLNPGQPPISLNRRCHATSVRPVRRFECTDTTVTGGIDYNWRHIRPWNPGAFYTGTSYGSPGFGMFQGQTRNASGGNSGWIHMEFGEGLSESHGGVPGYDMIQWKYNVLSAAGVPMLQPSANKNQLLPHWPQIYFHCKNWKGWGVPAANTWSTLYTVTIYDIHENQMGKWNAESWGAGGCGAHAYCQRHLDLTNIVHIQGPSPIVQLTGDEYVLIERRNSPSTGHKVNTIDLYNYAGTGTSIRMIDQFTNQPILGPVPYWKACIEYCANNYGPFAACCSGCTEWGVSIAPNQIFTPDPPWWTPPHGIGSVPWSAAPGTPGNPFSTIGALKSDCSQLKSVASGGACGVTTPWWYAPFRWVNAIVNPTPSSKSKQLDQLLSQDCSKDSSYFTEIDGGNKPLTSLQQLNLISKKLNKFAKRIKNKFR
tara:strand:- start:2789 stop:5581 length:2793 start_codon:yes stop_codon:yes gene_type:complete